MMFAKVLAVFLHLPSDKRNQLTFNTLCIPGKYYLLKQGRRIPFSSPQPFVVLSENILCSHFNPETSQPFESFLQTFHQSLVIQRWTEKVNIFSCHQDPLPSSPLCLPVAPSPQLFKKLKFPSASFAFYNSYTSAAVHTLTTGVFWTGRMKSWRFREWRPQTETKQRSGKRRVIQALQIERSGWK